MHRSGDGTKWGACLAHGVPKLVLVVAVLASLSLLFIGHLMYPVAPLFLPTSRSIDLYDSLSHHRVEASIATAAFVLATSLRTMIMTPLMILHDEERACSKSSGRLLTKIVHKMDAIIEGLERFSHNAWEDAARQSGILRGEDDYETSTRPVPEIDLHLLVPCNLELARIHLLGIRTTGYKDDNSGNAHGSKSTVDHDEPLIRTESSCSDSISSSIDSAALGICRLRDVITRNLLIEYAKLFYDDTFELATHPIILRNLWPSESFDEPSAFDDGTPCGSCPPRSRHMNRKLTPNAIMNDPQLSNLLLPNYFIDAANKTGYAALVPDVTPSQSTLSQFIKGILSGDHPNAKIGTQLIIERFPELRNEIIPQMLAKELFGWNTILEDYKTRFRNLFYSDEIGSWIMKLVPPMTYYPVFIASNQQSSDGSTHPRTDLHAEPIGNIASQLHGMRRWTLVPTMWSGLLRPTVSRHRGYFFSNIDPLVELPKRLNSLPLTYTCITRRGDSVWIPPWVCVYLFVTSWYEQNSRQSSHITVHSFLKMWHRVDYDGDDGAGHGANESTSKDNLSIGASIFHFYPTLYITNFPLFSLLIIPNMLKELFGFNIE